MLAARCSRPAGAAAPGLLQRARAAGSSCRAAVPAPRQDEEGGEVGVFSSPGHAATSDRCLRRRRRRHSCPACSARRRPALRWRASAAQPLRSTAAHRTPRICRAPAMAAAGALPLLLPLLLPSAADAATALPHLPEVSGYWMALGLGAAGVTTTVLLTSRFLVS